MLSILRAFFSRNVQVIDRLLETLELKYNLPGRNSVDANKMLWDTWDWRHGGEEWTLSEEWKRSLIEDVMARYIRPNGIVLEIGPGAGRWTEALRQMSKLVIVVDVSEVCIDLCKERFSHVDNISYHVNDGRTLPFIGDETIDSIWSFDVFVHIAPSDIESYISELSRVLKKGGVGIIHHASTHARHGFRSRTTPDLIVHFLTRHRLALLDQFTTWGDRNQFSISVDHRGINPDVITVLKK
jgi:ubiquinone/menaquinone biosynthesis C-methylase UbiE